MAGFLGVFASTPTHADVTATLDLGQRHQTIDGFGTAVQGDSEGWYGWDIASDNPQTGDPARVQQYADLMFDRLGASILRFEVGHYAAAPRLTSRTDLDYTTDVGFQTATSAGSAAAALTHNRGLLDLDAYRVRPGVQMAIRGRAVNPDLKLIGTAWTPPFYMKDALVTTDGQGNVIETLEPSIIGDDLASGTLNPARVDEYAHYLAAWVAEFEATTGSPMYGLSVQNEPDLSTTYNSTVYRNPQRYIAVLEATRDALDAAGLNHVRLFGPELTSIGIDAENFVGDTFSGDGGFFTVSTWMEAIAQAEAQRGEPLLDVIATHGADGRSSIPSRTAASDTQRRWDWYWNGRDLFNDQGQVVPGGDGDFDDAGNFEVQPGFYAFLDEFPGIGSYQRPGWMTEYSGASHDWAPDANPDGLAFGALDQAIAVYEALVHGNQSAYVLWQLAHDDYGSQIRRDEALVLDLDDADAPKLAAFQHFSKLITPGMERFDVAVTEDATPTATLFEDGTEPAFGVSVNNRGEDVLAAGFVDGPRFTLVLINPTGDDETITIDLSALLANPNDGVHLFRSTETERFAPRPVLLPDGNGVITFTLPAESIVTLSDLASGLAAIPEPGTAALVGFAVLLAYRRPSPRH
ncbi:MAG: hypothetical protein AAGF84_02695 [Planctomycetota bacterium]